MKIRPVRSLIVLLSFSFWINGCTQSERTHSQWWRGNLHTHSLWSDGDDYPEMIMDWYKAQGYHFVALSDHNILAEGDKWIDISQRADGLPILTAYEERFGTDWVDQKNEENAHLVRLKTLVEYRTLFEENGRFLIIKSEEITDSYESRPVHLNATNLSEFIAPQHGNSVFEVMQNNVEAVLAQREQTGRPMFPHLNHPNFGWAVTVEDIIRLEGEKFFEVYNGHPMVRNYGDETHLGTERMWDIILAERLSSGKEVMYGLATDDTHNYHTFSPERSNPGRGWVMVRSDQLTPASLITALEAGDFYATTGVMLDDIRHEENRIKIVIQAEDGISYTTRFVGTTRYYAPSVEEISGGERPHFTRRNSDDIGVILAEMEGNTPEYTLSGQEMYVRAVIRSSRVKANPYQEGDVETAWIQPFVFTP